MIKELKQKGWTLTVITEEIGCNRKMIRKYLNQEKLPQASRGSKLDQVLKRFLKSARFGKYSPSIRWFR